MICYTMGGSGIMSTRNDGGGPVLGLALAMAALFLILIVA
jgi:hypothetical protein